MHNQLRWFVIPGFHQPVSSNQAHYNFTLLLLSVTKSTGSPSKVLFVCFHMVEISSMYFEIFQTKLGPLEALHIEPLDFLCTESAIPHRQEAIAAVILFLLVTDD